MMSEAVNGVDFVGDDHLGMSVEHGAYQGGAAPRVTDEQAEVLEFREARVVARTEQRGSVQLGPVARSLRISQRVRWAGTGGLCCRLDGHAATSIVITERLTALTPPDPDRADIAGEAR